MMPSGRSWPAGSPRSAPARPTAGDRGAPALVRRPWAGHNAGVDSILRRTAEDSGGYALVAGKELNPMSAAAAGDGPRPSRPLLSVSGVAVRFGPLHALDGVDLAVRPGELVALAGENGAGKTTLVRCIAGDIRPTSGKIVIDGRQVTRDRWRPRARASRSCGRTSRSATTWTSPRTC